jgi:hypothetical protein
MPKIQQTMADVNVRSHTFHFVTPAMTDALKIPNAYNVCHADKSTGWATAALKTVGGPLTLARIGMISGPEYVGAPNLVMSLGCGYA